MNNKILGELIEREPILAAAYLDLTAKLQEDFDAAYLIDSIATKDMLRDIITRKQKLKMGV